MSEREVIRQRARLYLEHEVDDEDRAELTALVDRDDDDAATELASRFSGRLPFGTAGIRGLVGAGESRMNRAVVIQVTYGVIRYLLDRVPDAAVRGIAVARDARHRSESLQKEVAAVAAGLGVSVHWLEGPTPTPVLAFAVEHIGTACGVVITASHNPPAYNGYKVYWENGAQIIPPIDAGIADAIDTAPWPDEIERAPESSLIQTVSGIDDAYRSAASSVRAYVSRASTLKIAYSALHGVGQKTFIELMEQNGFSHLYPVASQAVPDPEFPTVSFPNPEEPGALDLVLAHAKANDCSLILVNDPDADRLGVAARGADGDFTVLNGNEIGVLLAHHVLTTTRVKKPLVLASVVSSRMLSVMAAALGARYEDTLTGFKWIANEAMRLEFEEGCHFVFGYEEALGYTIGTVVRDKDGLSAALVMAELASTLESRGETIQDQLRYLSERFGVFTTRSKSVTLDGPSGAARIDAAMAALRSQSVTSIGGEAVETFADLALEERMSSNVLLYDLRGGGRVAVRPSGTEPKIKFYLEVVGPDARSRLQAMEDDIVGRALS